MFIDSDDFIEPNMVEALLKLKAKSNGDIVCCGMCRYTETSSNIIEETVSKKEIEIFNRQVSLKRLILASVDCSSCNSYTVGILLVKHDLKKDATMMTNRSFLNYI